MCVSHSDRYPSLIVTFTNTDDLLPFTPFLDLNEALFLSRVNNFFDLFLEALEMIKLLDCKVLYHVSLLVHQHKEAFIVEINAGVFVLLDDGAGDHVTCAVGLLVLLISENILASNHSLSRAVLTWFCSWELSDLAWEFSFHREEGSNLSATSFIK